MKSIILISFLVLANISLTAQDLSNPTEVNWINNKSFKKVLAKFPEEKGKSATIIYANEINTGTADSIIKYISQENSLKNVYIFANKITFSGKLYFKLTGIFDTTKVTNAKRDGGNLIIYANTADFLDEGVLNIETIGEYNTYHENLDYSINEIEVKRNGGTGGSVFLIFENLQFDDSRIITKSIDSLNAMLSSPENIPEEVDTTKNIEAGKQEFVNSIIEIEDVFGEDFYNAYKEKFETKIASIKSELSPVKYWKDFNLISAKLLKEFFFEFMLTYIKESLKFSKNFGDLNKGEKSDYTKLFSSGFTGLKWGQSIPTITENLFLSYRGSPGNNFRIENQKIYYAGKNNRNSVFGFYNNLAAFLNDHTELEEIAAKWIILILKDVKVKLEKAIKNTDYAAFINTISYYNSLPDIIISQENLLDSYTNLLKEINTLREKYNLRVLPLKNNVVQEIKNGKVNFYALPGFSLVKNYYSDNSQKLGILDADVNSKVIELNFNLKLIPTSIDVEFARQASDFNKGIYSGMYEDWTLVSFELPTQGINKNASLIRKEGDLLVCKLVLTEDNKLPLALLFGNGNFLIKLMCYSNSDKDFKFELNLPINFRYRTINKLKIVNGNSVTNTGENDVNINGILTNDNKLTVIEPLTIAKTETKIIGQSIKNIPPEMIENVMAIEFRNNYKYFEDLTENKQFIQEVEIINNFPLTSNGNIFQELIFTFQYFDGVSQREKKFSFTKPKEKQVIKIIYPQDKPDFTIKGSVLYENETILIPIRKVNDWHITLDQSIIKN